MCRFSQLPSISLTHTYNFLPFVKREGFDLRMISDPKAYITNFKVLGISLQVLVFPPILYHFTTATSNFQPHTRPRQNSLHVYCPPSSEIGVALRIKRSSSFKDSKFRNFRVSFQFKCDDKSNKNRNRNSVPSVQSVHLNKS